MRAYKSRAHADYVVSGPIDLVAAPDGRKYDFRCVFLPEQGNVLTLKELRFSPHRESAN
jgi:hypothetical protein